MPQNALSPAFVRLHIVSAYSEHVMTLPTRAWNDPSNDTLPGTYTRWDDIAIDADNMINAFVEDIMANYDATVTCTYAEVYTQADENSPAILQRVFEQSEVGTSTLTGQVKAVQHTYSLIDGTGNRAKLILLDAVLPASGWEKVTQFAALNATQETMLNTFMSTAYAWSTRAGNRPSAFTQFAVKLNDKLRRSYGMN